MPCSLIDSIESLYTAYRELIARCCPDTTPISPDPCVIPSMLNLYNTVLEMIESESCGKLSASEDAPDPGEVRACISGEWIESCKAWIEGLTCENFDDVCLFEELYVRTSGPPGNCYEGGGGPALQPFEAIRTNPTGAFANLVLTTDLDVDDQLLIDGVRWDPNPCAAHYTIPSGTVLVENVAPGQSIVFTVEDCYGPPMGISAEAPGCLRWVKI